MDGPQATAEQAGCDGSTGFDREAQAVKVKGQIIRARAVSVGLPSSEGPESLFKWSAVSFTDAPAPAVFWKTSSSSRGDRLKFYDPVDVDSQTAAAIDT